jgi:hypothetical protein
LTWETSTRHSIRRFNILMLWRARRLRASGSYRGAQLMTCGQKLESGMAFDESRSAGN